MPIAAEVYVKHPDLALAETIQSVPDADLGVFSDAGTDPQHEAYFFWIEAPDFDVVEEALTRDPTVSEFSTIIEGASRRTYRIAYSPEAKLISPPMTEIGGVIADTRSHLDGWLLELRLQNHDGLYELNEYAEREGITLDVLEVRQIDTPEEDSDFGLTEPQREALVAACLHGYYDDPREADLEDLADLLDVSPTAVSGRLRRGSARLIEEVFLDDGSE
ncbi:MAG: helix-turn-helix domain-containing protein [Halobacteriales archaeon]